MAFHLYEDTWETTTTIGQGDYVLAGAVAGWRPFHAQYADGDTTWYSAFDGVNFEHGIGTYHAPNTITRTTVLRSTNSGNAVVWTAGTRQITVAPLGVVLEQIASGQGTSTVVADVPPSSPKVGTLWLDTVACKLYVWYDDGTSAQWVSTSGAAGPVGPPGPGSPNDVGRNLLHNSQFNIAQRGVGPFTSFGSYTADRWKIDGSLDTVSFSLGAFSDTGRSQIGDETATKFLENDFTGNAGAAAQSYIEQRIEGVRRLAGKTVTVSFWAVSSAAQKLGVNIVQIFGTGGSPSPYVQVLATGISFTTSGTWARFTTTIAIPSAAGKTLGTNGDDFTILRFYYSSGAINNPSAGNIGVQSGIINLWGVQLEIGPVATPLEKPDPRYDLANCQRFYQVIANVTLSGSGGFNMLATVSLPVTMRATPTVVIAPPFYNNASGMAVNNAANTSIIMFANSSGPGASVAQASIFMSADL